jgi:Flp pilus assembly protein TadG
MARIGLRRRLRSESGAELVETALTLPLLLLVVVGIIEFGFVFQKYEVITNAAREGARILVLPAFTPADAQARVNQYLEAAGLDPDEATVPLPAAAAPEVLPSGTCIETRTVTLSYPHEAPFLSGIGSYFGGTFGTFTLNASSTMRSESAAGVCPPPPPAP